MNGYHTTAFAALADPTRLSIVDMLAHYGELSASEISDRFRTSASAISQHLRVLREARLVVVEKRAQKRIYHIDAESMQQLEAWLSARARTWNGRIDAMDAAIREQNNKGAYRERNEA